MKKFKFTTSVNKVQKNVEEKLAGGGGLQKYKTFVAQEGINVLMPLPGTEDTDGMFMVARRMHQMWLPNGNMLDVSCARENESDRFETCPLCDHWWNNRSSKKERDAGHESAADDLYPSTKGVMVVINLTPFVEHETERKGSDVIMVPISSEIDPDRVEQKLDCFLDEKQCDPNSEKCQKCFAFNACYQGPQFFLISKKRMSEVFDKINKIGGKKTRTAKVKIGDAEVALRGNYSMAWYTLFQDEVGVKNAKKIAKMVSYPIEYKKVIDETVSNKRFATSYTFDTSRTPFLIPPEWQERAFSRAPDLAEYCKPSSKKEAQDVLNTWLKAINHSNKPSCFGDEDVFNSEECIGTECEYYKKCKRAVKENSDDDEFEGRSAKVTIKKHKKSEMKLKKRKQDDDDDDFDIEDFEFEDEDDADEFIEKLSKKNKKNVEDDDEEDLDDLFDDDDDDDDEDDDDLFDDDED